MNEEYDIIGKEKYKTHSGDEFETDIQRHKCLKCGNNTFYIDWKDTSGPGCGYGGDYYQTCTKCGEIWDE